MGLSDIKRPVTSTLHSILNRLCPNDKNKLCFNLVFSMSNDHSGNSSLAGLAVLGLGPCVHAKSVHSYLTFCDLWTVTHQAPLFREFSRKEYWSGLPGPPPGDLPNPGIKSMSLMSPAWAEQFFITSTTWDALGLGPGMANLKTNKQTNGSCRGLAPAGSRGTLRMTV